MISSYREAHCLRRRLSAALRTTLQQTSVAYRTRTCLFMRLLQHSTSNLSRKNCHKHCHYPKLHSTHIAAHQISRFVQRTTTIRVSLGATQNCISWTYSTPVSFLRLSNFVAFFDRVVCLIWRWDDESTGSRRRWES